MMKLMTIAILASAGMQLSAMEQLPLELQKICQEKGSTDSYHCNALKDMFECARLQKIHPRSKATAALCGHRVNKHDKFWALSYHVHNVTYKMPVEDAIRLLDETTKKYEAAGGFSKKQ